MDLGSPAQQPEATLEGVEWQLEESIGPDGELVEVPAEVLATANFADARVSGSTGCNRYSGSYTITDDGALSISEVVSTMMACLPEADAVERAMLTALDRTVRAQLGVDRLSLIDADGVELLRFRPAVAPPLVGTEWVAIGINNGRGGVVSALEAAGSRRTSMTRAGSPDRAAATGSWPRSKWTAMRSGSVRWPGPE